MLTALRQISRLELRARWRHAQAWLDPAIFFIMVMSLFPLALTPDPDFLQLYAPRGVWIAALLASMLAMESLFDPDKEAGHLDQLLLSPLPLYLLVAIKIFIHWLVTTLPLILLTPLLGLLFHWTLPVTLALLAGLMCGTPILALLGALATALTISLRQQGVLLGLLVLPLSLPVLIFGVSVVQHAQSGESLAGPLAFLAGLAVLSLTLLPAAIAATLRIGLDD